ncbi:chemotaxis protein methyltransferase CheR [Ectothiorhodospira magna]|uniref:Chemotaxis protein methyltransferase CheR n=1 Tax=Ectothiorhodospira magna TaxID=867345 RepID=A0A1H9C1E6_9GAMM|nr:chemotaxis protein methyltransferase CheR [Ectothiorhodospira magna]
MPEYKIKHLRGYSNPLRIWSAASSSGEEAYSLAMVCDDVLGTMEWEILGSDINSSILDKARLGLYEMSRIEGIPQAYLKRYCLKGIGSHSGQLLVDASLRNKVFFMRLNLNDYLPDLGGFDIIFLRNVLIYFEMATKQKVVSRVLKRLNPGGWFFVSHSESLNGIQHDLVQQAPAVYRKEAAA